jgi:hypothetical protein
MRGLNIVRFILSDESDFYPSFQQKEEEQKEEAEGNIEEKEKTYNGIF